MGLYVTLELERISRGRCPHLIYGTSDIISFKRAKQVREMLIVKERYDQIIVRLPDDKRQRIAILSVLNKATLWPSRFTSQGYFVFGKRQNEEDGIEYIKGLVPTQTEAATLFVEGDRLAKVIAKERTVGRSIGDIRPDPPGKPNDDLWGLLE